MGTNKSMAGGPKEGHLTQNLECERRAAKTKDMLRPGVCSPLPSSIESTSCFMWLCVGLAGVAETACKAKVSSARRGRVETLEKEACLLNSG